MSHLSRQAERDPHFLETLGERCRRGLEMLVRRLRESQSRRSARRSPRRLAFDTLEARDVPATTYQLSLPCFTVGEGAGSASITVNRTGDVSVGGYAFYDVTSGTATDETWSPNIETVDAPQYRRNTPSRSNGGIRSRPNHLAFIAIKA